MTLTKAKTMWLGGLGGKLIQARTIILSTLSPNEVAWRRWKREEQRKSDAAWARWQQDCKPRRSKWRCLR